MSDEPIDLYERLPAVYRRRDAERGRPLRALLKIISEQAELVRQDTYGLLDDFFIETADEWVIPYIGDLVGNEALHEVVQGRRADVAKTIYYRRRKGTLPIVEEVARDVTGWGARAVEFFRQIGWTQNLDHLRTERTDNPRGVNPEAFDRVGTANLRNMDALDRIDGPFDEITHTADVRPLSSGKGWHEIPDVGIFLWRLPSYPLEEVPSELGAWVDPSDHSRGAYGYFVSPLGIDRPLFTNPAPEIDPTGGAEEAHVPAPIRPVAFAGDLLRYRRDELAPEEVPESTYVGASSGTGPVRLGDEVSLVIRTADGIVDPEHVVCMDLEGWPRPPAHVEVDGEPLPVEVAVDVERGRLSFAPGKEPDPDSVACSFCYGFPGDVGGGPYDRRARIREGPGEEDCGEEPHPDAERSDTWFVVVQEEEPANPELNWVPEVRAAYNQWDQNRHPRAVIEIRDNRVYTPNYPFELTVGGTHLEIRAGNQYRPVIHHPVRNIAFEAADHEATVALSGLILEGRRVEFTGDIEHVRVADCTLVPGYSLEADGTPRNPSLPSLVRTGSERPCRIHVERSITGPIHLDAESHELTVLDSIVDAPERPSGDRSAAIAGAEEGKKGPPLRIERSTVFGRVEVRSIPLASEVIFMDRVVAERLQTGCVRYSYVPPDSRTPRRYECQPGEAVRAAGEEAEEEAGSGLTAEEKEDLRTRLRPRFTTRRFGEPAYAQLARSCREEIRTGGENGAEMGVYNHLHQPQREANLRMRLREYLPFGLEEGLIYVT